MFGKSYIIHTFGVRYDPSKLGLSTNQFLYKFVDFDTNLYKINYFLPNANEKFRFSGDSSPVVFPR